MYKIKIRSTALCVLGFYAFADIRGKTGHKLDYWPDKIEWWMPLPKIPKK